MDPAQQTILPADRALLPVRYAAEKKAQQSQPESSVMTAVLDFFIL